jgi:hypothetical protein
MMSKPAVPSLYVPLSLSRIKSGLYACSQQPTEAVLRWYGWRAEAGCAGSKNAEYHTFY